MQAKPLVDDDQAGIAAVGHCARLLLVGTVIYAAEWAWHSRWLGQSPTALLPADMFPDVPTLRAQWSDHERTMRAFLSNRDEDGINQSRAPSRS